MTESKPTDEAIIDLSKHAEKAIKNRGPEADRQFDDAVIAAIIEEKRLDKPEPQTNWQPIDTAPRDGTVILLAGGRTDENDYKNEIPKYLSRPVTGFWDPPKDEWDKGGWLITYWDGAWRTGYNTPRYWMPIEPLPTHVAFAIDENNGSDMTVFIQAKRLPDNSIEITNFNYAKPDK